MVWLDSIFKSAGVLPLECRHHTESDQHLICQHLDGTEEEEMRTLGLGNIFYERRNNEVESCLRLDFSPGMSTA